MRRRLPNLSASARAWACRGGLCALLMLAVGPALAAPAEHSRAELRAEVGRLEGVVRACAAAAKACDAKAVPDDEVVGAEGAQTKFAMRWGWLGDALDAAKSAKPEERVEAMQTSAARLEEISRQADAGGDAAQMAAQHAAREASFRKARSTADDVLARVEFDKVAPPSWWDRLVAKFFEMLNRLFDGVGKLGQRQPWLGKALEWGFFLAAAVGLVFFLRRNFQRQRLAASLRGEQAALTAWDREATDWAAMAERAAAGGDWREAVHCLYWAAIVRLESRRAWRHNPARTPREYVRLLKPGSVQRESLGGLTGLLERVWYGLRPAGAEEYGQARSWFERLSEAGGAGSTHGGVAAVNPAAAGGASGLGGGGQRV